MKKINRKLRRFSETLIIFLLLSFYNGLEVFAQDADRVVERGADYLIARLGPAVFLVGIVVSGISLAAGSRNGVIRGIYAIVGGIIILAARAIFNSVRGFAN